MTTMKEVTSELREAARQFHNLTQGDSTVIIRPPSAEKRDAIIAAGERLRAAINASPAPEAHADAAPSELASMTRMFHAACADLGAINEALGLDPDDGGAEPIIEAINELKAALAAGASVQEPIYQIWRTTSPGWLDVPQGAYLEHRNREPDSKNCRIVYAAPVPSQAASVDDYAERLELAKALCRIVNNTGMAVWQIDVIQRAAKILSATPQAATTVPLTDDVLQKIVQSRGRADGSLWVFDSLAIILLVNDVARALLASPAADSQDERAVGIDDTRRLDFMAKHGRYIEHTNIGVDREGHAYRINYSDAQYEPREEWELSVRDAIDAEMLDPDTRAAADSHDERAAFSPKEFESSLWELVEQARVWEKAYRDPAELYSALDSYKTAVEQQVRYIINSMGSRAASAPSHASAAGAEGKELTALDADIVWPAYDGETSFHSIDDAVQYEIDQAWPTQGPLELKLDLAKKIPRTTIRIFDITENGHEWEIVSDAPASSTGDQEVQS